MHHLARRTVSHLAYLLQEESFLATQSAGFSFAEAVNMFVTPGSQDKAQCFDVIVTKLQLFRTAALNRAREDDDGAEISVIMQSFVTETTKEETLEYLASMFLCDKSQCHSSL